MAKLVVFGLISDGSLTNFERTVINGASGNDKTILVKSLCEILSIDSIYLDELFGFQISKCQQRMHSGK